MVVQIRIYIIMGITFLHSFSVLNLVLLLTFPGMFVHFCLLVAFVSVQIVYSFIFFIYFWVWCDIHFHWTSTLLVQGAGETRFRMWDFLAVLKNHCWTSAVSYSLVWLFSLLDPFIIIIVINWFLYDFILIRLRFFSLNITLLVKELL